MRREEGSMLNHRCLIPSPISAKRPRLAAIAVARETTRIV
jgi:hypothetical protein